MNNESALAPSPLIASVTRIWYLVKKEVSSYFNSPIAYIVIIFFIGFSAMWLFVVQQFLVRNIADLRPYFAIMPSLLIVIIPALTMRSWAEERKLGTDELLLTLPYNETELVVAKFMAVQVMIYIMQLLSLPVPLLVAPLGDFEAGQIIGQYIGMLLFSMPVVAIGLFLSNVSKNQISAFLVSVVILIVLSLINRIALILSPAPLLSELFEYLSLSRHFRSFEIGLLDTRDVIYYLVLTWAFLYANVKLMIWRKKR